MIVSPGAAKSRMRRGAALLLLAACALAVAWVAAGGTDRAGAVVTRFWRINYTVFPVKDRAALAAIHADPSRVARERCAACHEGKKGSNLVLHRIHLRSELLTNLECPDCHQHIDLETRSNRAVVTWVDVGFCRQCHSAFPGLDPGSPMKPEYFEADCTSCHTGERAPKHDKPYLPTSIPSSECKGCHGGRTLPSTVRHEGKNWLAEHGDEALASGSEACYACHDFGLKFCDECHGEKPPSHRPAERWRTVHPEEARADTRVCYSCHRTGDCKKCHLNHETGWMARHAAHVRDKGDASCLECHSRSSCGYCHMLTSAPSEVASDTP